MGKIEKNLAKLKVGESASFFDKGDPVFLRKGAKMGGPTLLEGIDRPRTAKAIIDPSYGKVVEGRTPLSERLFHNTYNHKLVE